MSLAAKERTHSEHGTNTARHNQRMAQPRENGTARGEWQGEIREWHTQACAILPLPLSH